MQVLLHHAEYKRQERDSGERIKRTLPCFLAKPHRGPPKERLIDFRNNCLLLEESRI